MMESSTDEARRRAIGAYALADPAALSALCGPLLEAAPPAEPVRGPEIGLVMLRGRAGGGGAPFNLGEASVTSATVRLATGEVGSSMILGRDADKARAAAHLDALWQRDEWRARIEAEIVEPAIAADERARARLAEETQATRVDFFTMVRGEEQQP